MDDNSFRASFDPDADDIKVSFTEEEQQRLITYFTSKDFNQFYLVVILKVLEEKTFTSSNNDIITKFLPIIDSVDKADFNIDSDEKIINYASTIYAFLMTVDIEEFGDTQF